MRVQELFDLSGRVAIVTGGYTGLGYQMAEALAEAGANVVICARRVQRCEEAAQKLQELGVKTLAVKCDVSQEADVDALVQATLDKFGRIDILVSNAGIAWGDRDEDISVENWEKVIKVNLTGVHICCQRVGRVMLEAGYGKIINISSVSGLVGVEYMDSPPYVAAKGAVISMTKSLAVKWAKRGVYVNCIAPGFFASHMSELFFKLEGKREATLASIPLGRLGGPDDLKGAVVFLAAAASDFCTGSVLVVDGGHSAW